MDNAMAEDNQRSLQGRVIEHEGPGIGQKDVEFADARLGATGSISERLFLGHRITRSSTSQKGNFYDSLNTVTLAQNRD